ncbi:transposase [Bacillus alkalicellulosilyticus]|uniref:transposase n=1 Tax=Alkalihalobacterium alkalicellulosilyticum TaxID=1912214 RepID=UPI00099775F5|nr:transposase [Bacillus alkalicellulosilyticus]
MKIILILGSVVIPALMVIIYIKWNKFGVVFDSAAILATLVFGNISAVAIHQILVDNTVFMTNIHALFLNPLFLLTGAYLGVYLLYRLTLRTFLQTE